MTPHVTPAADAGPAMRARDLAVGYRSRGAKRPVLERMNFEAHAGELVCLLGPNGIGKSTLLRTLARMQPALSGTVEVSGADLRAMTHAELARHLGVVLTERVLVEGMSARRIVELGRYPHSGFFGTLTDRDRAAVDFAIDAVGARHLGDRDFSRLSDGERQRVMIARALAQEPRVLVLDEPTAFLDVPSRVELVGLLRRLTRESALAVVVSTHDLELALRTADLIWLLLPGGALTIGAPEDIVLAGGLAEAFGSRHLQFHAADRTFRLRGGERGTAVVHGEGLPAALAAAVVEREGFTVVSPPETHVLSIRADGSGWAAANRATTAHGQSFASLAAFLRHGGTR